MSLGRSGPPEGPISDIFKNELFSRDSDQASTTLSAKSRSEISLISGSSSRTIFGMFNVLQSQSFCGEVVDETYQITYVSNQRRNAFENNIRKQGTHEFLSSSRRNIAHTRTHSNHKQKGKCSSCFRGRLAINPGNTLSRFNTWNERIYPQRNGRTD